MTALLRALVLVGFLTAPAAAQEKPALPKTFDPEAVDAYISAWAREKKCVGLSVAVMRDGKLILAKGYGTVSLPNGPPVSSSTRFAIGSVSKQFTCACILLLAEDGKLSIRDKVSKYYPDLTRANDISLHDLMTHSSGYPDYYPLDFVDRRMARPIDPDELIRQYAGGKLDFEPGTRWSYSNTGYIILGRVAEKVSGQSFGTFLESRIFKPLRMTGAAYEPGKDVADRASGYLSFALGDPEPAPPEASGWIHAAGGIWATPTDLARWNQALLTGQVLKPESYQIMTTPRQLADGRKRNYGLGLMIGDLNGEAVLSHSGAVSGFHANSALVPRTKSSVVVLSNAEHVDTAALHQELLGLLVRGEGASPIPKVVGPSPRDAAADLFRQMQAGVMKRDQLGEEFSHYLTESRVLDAAPRLKALGDPDTIVVDGVSERGGMEVARIRLVFKNRTVKASLYRTPDGKVQQFLLTPG